MPLSRRQLPLYSLLSVRFYRVGAAFVRVSQVSHRKPCRIWRRLTHPILRDVDSVRNERWLQPLRNGCK